MRLQLLVVLGVLAGNSIVELPQAAAQQYQYQSQTRPKGLFHIFPRHEDKIEGVSRWSYEDYEIRGQLPPGVRQMEYKGRKWPVAPRPVGPKPHMIHRYHTAHYWPHPYNAWDRMGVVALNQMQISNGWTDATTLYSYHFEAETNDLKQSGILHIQWVLQEAPACYQALYIQTSAEPGVNEIRKQLVQDAAMRLLAGEAMPQITMRNTTPSGRPAVEVDAIRNGELLSQPIPRIEYQSESASGL